MSALWDVGLPFRLSPSHWALILVLLSGGLVTTPAHGQGAVQWRTNYYDVSGSSIREIRRSMRRNRPPQVELDALTEWSLRARCSPSPFQGAYRCAGFNTTLAIRITLPRWTPPEGASDFVKEAWGSYITALTEHELGHAQFALSAAAELHRQVREMGTYPSPEAVQSQVQSLVMSITEEFKQREEEYDRLTNHGVDHGVVLAIGDEPDGERPSLERSDRSDQRRRRRE